MTNEQVYSQLTEVFRDVFDDADIQPHPAMTATEVPEWDSFNHITLIVAIEARFGVKFSTAELESMRNVGQMAELITAKAR